jgi:hypothetical protein
VFLLWRDRLAASASMPSRCLGFRHPEPPAWAALVARIAHETQHSCRPVGFAGGTTYPQAMAERPRSFQFDLHSSEGGDWIEVIEGGLDQPIEVRVRYVGASLEIVGLRMDNARPITSTVLRTVRLADLTDQLHQFLRRAEAVKAALIQVPLDRRSGDTRPDGDGWVEPTLRGVERLLEWEDRLSNVPVTAETSLARGRGASPPTTADLRGFARVFLDECAAHPRGAVSRTARRIGVDRSTAHRWIKRCKEVELLPN